VDIAILARVKPGGVGLGEPDFDGFQAHCVGEGRI
jgi:hypothetical protein